jgi:hypothetical protein
MSNTTTTQYPTTVTIAEGYEVRVMAQTASRDYTAKVVAGTYPIEYTTIRGYAVPEGDRPYYARVRVQIESPERRESSVEFGGVTLATQVVPASVDNHTIQWYGYQVEDGKFAVAALTFGFDA